MAKKLKCLTCRHPLEEHTEEYCLHWNWDIEQLCQCKEGPDDEPLNKTYERVRVAVVIIHGKNFLMFSAHDGKIWRWMYKEKALFPVDVL